MKKKTMAKKSPVKAKKITPAKKTPGAMLTSMHKKMATNRKNLAIKTLI